jgi:hypothetical protein
MNVEQANKMLPEDLKWKAGKAEKIGAGISVVLLGGAFFFPEAGKVLPTASMLVALADLYLLAENQIHANLTNQVNMEHNHEVRVYEAGKLAGIHGVNVDVDEIA